MIDFVILHYQALEETIDCVNTILKRVSSDRHVFVVDNGSPNGSGKNLQQMFQNHPEVSVVLSEKNLGFARGNNLGYQTAKKNNPDYIVVMNNDVFLVQDDFSERVLKAFERTEFAILGPDIFSTRDSIHQNPQRAVNYTLGELKRYQKKAQLKASLPILLKIKYMFPLKPRKKNHHTAFINKPMENVVLHGSCYVLSRKYICRHNNCFYDGTFMYFESYILHLLGNREKLKFVYEPDIKVLHHEDVATNQTYQSGYSKAKFCNKCLLDSCGCFIKLMNDENARIG